MNNNLPLRKHYPAEVTNEPVIGQTQIMQFSERILTFMDTFYGKDIGARGAAEWFGYFSGKYTMSQFNYGLHKYGQDTDMQGRHLAAPTPADIIYRIEYSKNDSRAAWMMLQYAIERLGKYNAIFIHDIKVHYFIHRNGGWMTVAGTPREHLEYLKRRFVSEYSLIDVPENFEHVTFPSFYGDSRHYGEVKINQDGRLMFRLSNDQPLESKSE